MAAVSVFVDDAILRRLPLVCAKTGKPTDQVIRMQRPVAGGISGWALVLLLFLGPIGLVALVVLAILSPGAEYLTVRVPQAPEAFDHERRLERSRLASLIAGVALLAMGALGVGMFPVLWLVAGLAFLGAAAALHGKVLGERIGVSLDASRRWVTLTNVHPAFVAAAQREDSAGRLGVDYGTVTFPS
jgi:hypothetical protein